MWQMLLLSFRPQVELLQKQPTTQAGHEVATASLVETSAGVCMIMQGYATVPTCSSEKSIATTCPSLPLQPCITSTGRLILMLCRPCKHRRQSIRTACLLSPGCVLSYVQP